MQTEKKSLSNLKALIGIIFFFSMDLIAFVLFESPLLCATRIAYGSCVLAPAQTGAAVIAYGLSILIALISGNDCWFLAVVMALFWIIIALLRVYIRYSWPVRAVLVTLLLLASESSWYIAKMVLTLLWIIAGVRFFV